jgi:hypothetical protein
VNDPAAPAAVRCARSECTAPPTVRVVGRCSRCRDELRQAVCGEHRDELTTAMLFLNILSHCHRATVTLARIETLP